MWLSCKWKEAYDCPNTIVFTPPFDLPTNFSKKGGLIGPQLLEGGCWERGGTFFRGGCNIHIKNNQNLKNLMSEKVYKQKYLRIETAKFYLRI